MDDAVGLADIPPGPRLAAALARIDVSLVPNNEAAPPGPDVLTLWGPDPPPSLSETEPEPVDLDEPPPFQGSEPVVVRSRPFME